jgi:uncharacterized protein with FMN-binding domain
MMMTKKVLGILIVLLAAGLMITGCFVEYDPTDVPEAKSVVDSSGTPISGGPVTKTGPGYGGEVSVTVTLTNGYITGLTLDVSKEIQPDSPVYAGGIINNWIPLVQKANSFDVDVSTSATTTLKTVKKLGNQALFEITKGKYGAE